MSEKTLRPPVGGDRSVGNRRATEEEEAVIREEIGEFARGSSSNKVLHLPEPVEESRFGSLCHQLSEEDVRLVSVAAFPPGYAPICSYCTEIWRENDGE